MNINHLTTDAHKAVIDTLSSATVTRPATRQALAEAGNVARTEVGELLTRLRLEGWLILETEDGCWLGTSYAEYKEWRTRMLIPAMLLLLQVDQTMARTAILQFGAGRAEAA